MTAPTLREAVQIFLLIDRSSFTQRTYQSTLMNLTEAIGQDRDLRLVTTGDLADYFHRNTKRWKASTRATYVTIVKSFFTFAVKSHWLESSPANVLKVQMKPDRVGAKDRAMPGEILAAMIEATRYEPRNHAVILLLADTGCRVGAVESLTIHHLDLADRSAHVREKGGHLVPIYFGAETAAALERWLKLRPAAAHDHVFCSALGPLMRDGITAMIRAVSKRVCGREYGPHSIRHAVGNAYAMAAVPPTVTAAKLNHLNSQTTLNYYYPKDDRYVREASRELPLIAVKRKEDEQADRKGKIMPFPGLA
jgi:site-specific recombinase XerD